MTLARDHGGGLDAAIARYGGESDAWLDLSTGISPWPYPLPDLTADDWTALPDAGALARLIGAARGFWGVPDGADILAAAGGASALIALLPMLAGPPASVCIQAPTYNEHAAAFVANGWSVTQDSAVTRVVVHPNNPTGRLWQRDEIRPDRNGLLIIDESFCDVTPTWTHIGLGASPGVIILKSFGKFWGLAGLRLGFAVGHPQTLAKLRRLIGPWPVSGPALRIATAALADHQWAETARARLALGAHRLDALLLSKRAALVGGTDLFRTFAVENADAIYESLAQHRVLSRIFPYSKTWLRLGLPKDEDAWQQLEAGLPDTV